MQMAYCVDGCDLQCKNNKSKANHNSDGKRRFRRAGVIYSAKIINPKQITTRVPFDNGFFRGVIYSAKIINPKQITTGILEATPQFGV